MADNVCEDARIESLVRAAVGVHFWMKEKHTLTMTMRLVGFTDDECKNRTLQQRVRRQLKKEETVPVSAVRGPSLAVSDLSSPANVLLSDAAEPVYTPTMSSCQRNKSDTTTSARSNGDPTVNLHAKFQSVASDNPSSAGHCSATHAHSTTGRPALTKTRRTSRQLQAFHSNRQKEKTNKKRCFKSYH